MNNHSTTEQVQKNEPEMFRVEHKSTKKKLYMITLSKKPDGTPLSYRRMYSTSIKIVNDVTRTLKDWELRHPDEKVCIETLSMITGYSRNALNHVITLLSSCVEVSYRDPNTLRWVITSDRPKFVMEQQFKRLDPSKYGKKSPIYIRLSKKSDFEPVTDLPT